MPWYSKSNSALRFERDSKCVYVSEDGRPFRLAGVAVRNEHDLPILERALLRDPADLTLWCQPAQLHTARNISLIANITSVVVSAPDDFGYGGYGIIPNAVPDFGLLSPFQSLESLHCGSPTCYRVERLAELPHLTCLRFFGGTPERPFDLGRLAGLTKLEQLEVRGWTYRNVHALGALSHIASLHFDSPIQNEDINGLVHRLSSDLSRLSLPLDVNARGTQWKLTGLSNLGELSCPGLAAEDLDFLPGMPLLQSLNVSGSASLADISGLEHVPLLEHLDLSGCEKLRDLSPVASLPRLVTLSLPPQTKTNELARIVGRCKGIKDLVLRYCDELTDLSCLTQLEQLETLDIHSCRYVRDLEFLRDLSNLRRLHTWNLWNVRDYSALRALPRLERLHIQGDIFDTEAARRDAEEGDPPAKGKDDLSQMTEDEIVDWFYANLEEGRKEKEEPKELDADATDEDNDHGHLAFDVSWLPETPNLTALRLQSMNLLDVDAVKRVPKIVWLSLEGCQAKGGLDALAQLKDLVFVNLLSTPINLPWRPAADSLLQSVTFEHCRVKDVSPLSNAPRLERVAIRNDKRAPQALGALGTIPCLALLEVTKLPRDADLAGLASAPQLRQLQVDYVYDNRRHVDLAWVSKMSQLRYLCISGADNIEQEDLSDVFAQLGDLKGLSLSAGTTYDVRRLDFVRHLPDLQILSISGREGIADFSPLRLLTQLQRLNVSGTKITTEQLAAILQMPKLEYVGVEHCAELGDDQPLQDFIQRGGEVFPAP